MLPVGLAGGLVGLALGISLSVLAEWIAQRTRRGSWPWYHPALVCWFKAVPGGDGRGRCDPALSLAAMIELGSGLLVPLLIVNGGTRGASSLLIGAYAFFALIALIDVKCRRIPNLLVFPAIALALLAAVAGDPPALARALLGGVFGLGIFGITAWLRPGELGWGDVKLALLIGLLFGFPDALIALFVGVLTGGITAIVMIGTRRGTRSTRMPYAPFLCLGVLVTLLANPMRW